MKRSLLAAVAVAAAGLGVNAAAAHDFYVGAFAGGSDGDTDWTYQAPVNTADHSTDGSVYGIDVGWAKTWGHFYGGVEASYGWADVSGSADCPNPAFSCSSYIDSIASLRGIAGYAHQKWVFYGTAGFAWADATIETDDGAGPYGEDDDVQGYALGGGVQYQLAPHWSMRGEYIHYDFDESTFEVDFGDLVDAEISTDVYSLGVNYHF